MELWGLFASAFLAATVLPAASEVPLALLVRRDEALLVPVLVATLGNYLGACTTYAVARTASARVAPRTPGASRAARWFQRYGAPALLLSWVPIAGDGIVALAGAAHMPFLPFSLWTATGKAARYSAVAWLALRV